MKPTQTALADYIGITRQGIQKMKKDHPKKFALLWSGWVAHCKETNNQK